MSWSRRFFRRYFGPYMQNMSQDKTEKYLRITRMAYFFSTTSLALLIYQSTRETQDTDDPLSGLPKLIDHSEHHKRMRESGYNTGIIYKMTDKGVELIEFNKDEYYAQLERESYERARLAQEKAMAEGRELPKDAIKLV